MAVTLELEASGNLAAGVVSPSAGASIKITPSPRKSLTLSIDYSSPDQLVVSAVGTMKIEQPFQLLKGGYIGIYDVTSGSGWQQITAQLGPRHRRVRPPVGSRRERRRTPKHDWQRSTVKLGK